MAAFDFPATPTDGQTYTPAGSKVSYVYSNADKVWKAQIGAAAPLTAGRVLLGDGTSTPATDAELAYDATNKRLIVGGNASVAAGGDIQIAKGLTFPATQISLADPNTLDDYEEGTWTPTVTGVTGTGVTYTGSYTKIGRIAYCSLTINGTGLSGTRIQSTQPFAGLFYGVGVWMEGGTNSTGFIQSIPYGNLAQFTGTFTGVTVINSNWIMTV